MFENEHTGNKLQTLYLGIYIISYISCDTAFHLKFAIPKKLAI